MLFNNRIQNLKIHQDKTHLTLNKMYNILFLIKYLIIIMINIIFKLGKLTKFSILIRIIKSIR